MQIAMKNSLNFHELCQRLRQVISKQIFSEMWGFFAKEISHFNANFVIKHLLTVLIIDKVL